MVDGFVLKYAAAVRFGTSVLVAGWATIGCADVLGFERAELDESNRESDSELQSSDGGHRSDASVVSTMEPSIATATDAPTDAGSASEDGGDVDSDSESEPFDPDEVPSCERYCEIVLEACPSSEDSNYAVFDSVFSCVRQCQQFPEGEPGDATGNSRACRATHAQFALQFPGERGFECPAAGPGGDGVCGTNCEGYCALMGGLCAGSLEEDCMAQCLEVPDTGGYDTSIIEGNSLQCRLYHLGAATVSPNFHCAHAAGDDPCVDP